MRDIQTKYQAFLNEISDFTYGNQELGKVIFITLLIHGSILIEDLPGVGKTTLSKAISKLLGLEFSRIQGTSDMLPQDIVGGEFFDFETKSIQVKKGPIFTQLLLVDEINRMNPKTQSAFLQAMEEKKVSLQGKNYPLDPNFFVIATQNPIEYLGTFPLPEAQRDRFFSRISLGRPNHELQMKMIMENTFHQVVSKGEALKSVLENNDLDEVYQKILSLKISQDVAKRLVKFFSLIGESQNIIYPISQRGISIFISAMRANAFLQGRDYVISKDGEELISYFLLHRLDIEKNNENILLELYHTSFKNF